MSELDFDPSGVALRNGCYWGLECLPEDSEMVIQAAPWDVTTSYRPGTAKGPDAILQASYQLDFYTPFVRDAWNMKIGTLPFPKHILENSKRARAHAEKHIHFLEEGGDITDSPEMTKNLQLVNKASLELHEELYQQTLSWIKKGKKVVTVGGDHSCSFGPIRAYSEAKPGFSVLHFDAHADLREKYEGFAHSHASIMFDVLKLPGVKNIVQLGIRDVSPEEINLIETNKKMKTYFDWELKQSEYSGKSWSAVCDDIISNLADNVYISFDIDGFDPKLCPSTGTPVPGGLEFQQASYLIQAVKRSGRKIIGADLVEVAPAENGNEWDGNVGARTLYQICLGITELRS